MRSPTSKSDAGLDGARNASEVNGEGAKLPSTELKSAREIGVKAKRTTTAIMDKRSLLEPATTILGMTKD